MKVREQIILFRRGPRDFSRLLDVLSTIPTTEEFQVTIAPVKKERSDAQNRALWGCAYKTLRDATGNDPEDLHTYFCGEYFGWTDYEVMGQIRKRPRRTTTKDEIGSASCRESCICGFACDSML